LLDIMGESKEISQIPPNKIVDLLKSGSSMGAISKRLKVVRKYKHHGTTQPSCRSGRRRVLSPRDEHTLVWKVQINPRTAAKDLVKMLEETGTKVSMSIVLMVTQWRMLRGGRLVMTIPDCCFPLHVLLSGPQPVF
jgi:hypothetical protein